MRSTLLAVALMALSASAFAEVPASKFPTAQETGPLREQPQALSHWQKVAEDFADQAAPTLIEKGVSVSSRITGDRSRFDRAFHDFLVTALFDRGVTVTANPYGARIELDSFVEEFNGARATARIANVKGEERYGRATKDEFAVNIRIFDGGDVVYSGSTTYYLGKADLKKYKNAHALHPTHFERRHKAGEERVVVRKSGKLHGEYGTKTWNCEPVAESDCL